jgi:hypothetical protein
MFLERITVFRLSAYYSESKQFHISNPVTCGGLSRAAAYFSVAYMNHQFNTLDNCSLDLANKEKQYQIIRLE